MPSAHADVLSFSNYCKPHIVQTRRIIPYVEKKVAKRHRKTNYEKTLEACKDADEGRLNSYESVDDFFEKMGMSCQS